MKILYFTNKPAPYRVSFFNQLNEISDVTVVFDYNKNDYRNKNWYKDNIYKFKSINLNKISLFKLNKILKDRYDIVVIGTYASINGAILNLLLKWKKIKFFINADGGFIDYNENIFSKMIKKFFISKATYYLSSGKATNKYLEYYGANPEKIYIYPFTSLEEEEILEQPIKYEEKIKLRKKMGYKYKKLFVSVGTFIYRKGYDIFLESLLIYNNLDIGYVIIGGGLLKEEYIKFINDNNITNVHFVDFCDKKKIFEFYKMSDIFFFPSREDIWGLVINEAMAYGLPVISSNKVIAAEELINKENIYEFNDKEKLLTLLEKYSLMSNEELYKEGQKNINIIKKYTIKQMTIVHKKIFENVNKNIRDL